MVSPMFYSTHYTIISAYIHVRIWLHFTFPSIEFYYISFQVFFFYGNIIQNIIHSYKLLQTTYRQMKQYFFSIKKKENIIYVMFFSLYRRKRCKKRICFFLKKYTIEKKNIIRNMNSYLRPLHKTKITFLQHPIFHFFFPFTQYNLRLYFKVSVFSFKNHFDPI